MTNDKEKERLKEKFNNLFLRYIIPYNQRKEMGDSIFDFFYSEIERLHNTDDYLRGHVDGYADATVHSEAKLKSQSEIIQAADEVMKSLDIDHRPNWVHNTDETYEALEKYNSLKGKI